MRPSGVPARARRLRAHARAGCALLASSAALGLAADAGAQPEWRPVGARRSPVPAEGVPVGVGRPWTGRTAHAPATRVRWWAPLASLVVPGAGQAALGQSRAAGYAALDGYTWLQFAEARRDERRAQREYKRLARASARGGCAACPDGDWDYYERLEDPRWDASGAFDVVPGGDLDPETTPGTYNAAMWLQARETYWSDPDRPPPRDSPAYLNALAFYRARAYGADFAWNWRDQQQPRSEFRQAIARSNQANRTATTALSVVIANRALSLVDAFITIRVQGLGPGAPSRVSATVPWSRVPGLRRAGPR